MDSSESRNSVRRIAFGTTWAFTTILVLIYLGFIYDYLFGGYGIHTKSDSEAVTGMTWVFIFWITCVWLYFAPSLIAGHKNHNNFPAIYAINFAFGWTLLGWLIAFIWALAKAPQAQIAFHQPPPLPNLSQQDSTVNVIERLVALKSQGVLSEDEFQVQKARLLKS